MDLQKFRHGTPLTENNNAIDDGPLFIAPTALDAKSLRLNSIGSISGVFVHCKLACIIQVGRQQIEQEEYGPYRVCIC